MVIFASFNCNGIYDTKKWTPLWNLLKSTRADLIVLQETHLTEQQVYAFSLHAQAYEHFHLHGTSQSAGIAVFVHRNTGLHVTKFQPVSPHLRILDFKFQNWDLRLLACYALSANHECVDFFHELSSLVIPGLTVVMGDLNTVRTGSDRVLGRLDPTSAYLNGLCETNAWFEPQGANFFMYKHPTLDRQSHIDYKLGPKFLVEDMWLSGW